MRQPCDSPAPYAQPTDFSPNTHDSKNTASRHLGSRSISIYQGEGGSDKQPYTVDKGNFLLFSIVQATVSWFGLTGGVVYYKQLAVCVNYSSTFE